MCRSRSVFFDKERNSAGTVEIGIWSTEIGIGFPARPPKQEFLLPRGALNRQLAGHEPCNEVVGGDDGDRDDHAPSRARHSPDDRILPVTLDFVLEALHLALGHLFERDRLADGKNALTQDTGNDLYDRTRIIFGTARLIARGTARVRTAAFAAAPTTANVRHRN